MSKKVIIVSGPVILKNKKILLDISGEDDFWKFCGGQSNGTESLEETAVRRAKEELNVDVTIVNKKPFLMHIKKDSNDIVLVHWLSKCRGEIRVGKGVKDYGWLDIKSLPKNLGPNIKPALKHFNINPFF